MKVAVIGAGIIGVTTAYELAADGHAVTVFERRGAVAEETSFANAGMVAPGYVTPWDETPDWERQSAAAVYEQVVAFVQATGGAATKLTREQKGRFVSLCWIGQIYKHVPDPKPAYVADWDDLPEWQQETDADIFEHIEQAA